MGFIPSCWRRVLLGSFLAVVIALSASCAREGGELYAGQRGLEEATGFTATRWDGLLRDHDQRLVDCMRSRGFKFWSLQLVFVEEAGSGAQDAVDAASAAASLRRGTGSLGTRRSGSTTALDEQGGRHARKRNGRTPGSPTRRPRLIGRRFPRIHSFRRPHAPRTRYRRATIGFSDIVTAAYSESGTICSDKIEYEPVTNSEPGHHAGELWKSNCWGAGTSKRVTAAVLVKVNEDKLPLWDASKHGMHKRTTQGNCISY